MKKFIFIFSFILLYMPASAEIKGLCTDIGDECQILNSLAQEYNQNGLNEDIVFSPQNQRWIKDLLPLRLKVGESYDIVVTTAPFTLADWYLDISPYVSRSLFDIQYSDTQDWIIHEAQNKRLPGFTMGINFAHLYVNNDDIEITNPKTTYWHNYLEQSYKTAFERFVPENILIDPNGALWADIAISYGVDFIDSQGGFDFSSFQFRNYLEDLQTWKQEGFLSLGNWNLTARYRDNKQAFLSGEAASLYSTGFYYNEFLNNPDITINWDAIAPICGVRYCAAIPEQRSIIGIHTTKYPKEVAEFIEWLAQPEQQVRYAQATLSIPGYQPLQQSDLLFENLDERQTVFLQNLLNQYSKTPQNAFNLLKTPKNMAFYNSLLRQIRIAVAGDLSRDILKNIEAEFNRRSIP